MEIPDDHRIRVRILEMMVAEFALRARAIT